MQRVIGVALAVAIGVVAGWSAARSIAPAGPHGSQDDTAAGLLAGSLGALEAASRTLEQLEKPAGTWDPLDGWRTPILARPDAVWSDLFPWYEPDLPVDPPTLVGCVPGPGVPVAGCRDISSARDGVRFPGPGSWILETTYGGVKVLVLEDPTDPRQRAFDLATFVASNVVHSTADTRLFNPWRIEEIPALHVPRLFWSSQPIKDWCGGVAALAACVFENQGFATRKVEIGTLDDGHIVAEVDLDDGEWIAVDVDWGYLFSDERGEYLGVGTLHNRLIEGSEVVAVDIGGGKRWLRPELNADGVPPFHWSPTCGGRPREPEQLLAWLRDNLQRVRTSSFDTRLPSERTFDRRTSLERALEAFRAR